MAQQTGQKKRSVGRKISSRKNSENLDSHTYENTKPICEVTAAPIEGPQAAENTESPSESSNNSENLESSNKISENLKVKPETEIEREDASDEDVASGMRTYEAVFL